MFRYLETKKILQNRHAPTVQNKNKFRNARQKFFNRKSWLTPIMPKFLRYPKLVKNL